MNDQSVELLVQQLSRCEGKCLIVADENWANAGWHSVAHSGNASRTLFSNRYEIAESAKQAGIETCFNDFDFSVLEAASFDYILFRVSKERPVSHHIINQASALLKAEGQLLLSGEKMTVLKLIQTTPANYLVINASRRNRAIITLPASLNTLLAISCWTIKII